MSLIRGIATVGGYTLVSRVLGFLRDTQNYVQLAAHGLTNLRVWSRGVDSARTVTPALRTSGSCLICSCKRSASAWMSSPRASVPSEGGTP